MPVTTAAGLEAWLRDHPGNTAADFAAQQQADRNFASGYAPSAILEPANSPLQPLVASYSSVRQLAVSAGGGVGGGVVSGIASALPIIGGVLAGLLGGNPPQPGTLDHFISKLQDQFPDQNAPICDTPIDLSDLGGGGPVWLNVPCDDPGFGKTSSRSTIEWFIHTQGLGTFMRAVQLLLSPSPTGHPSFVEAATQAAQGYNINIAADAFAGVADAIKTSLEGTVKGVSDVANGLFGGIKDALGGIIGSLADGAKNILDNIGSVIKALADNIGSILKDLANLLWNAIKDLASKIADVIQNQIVPILKEVADAIGKIEAFYHDHIEPILQSVNQAIKVIQGAIVAIETDLKSGLKGFLQLPQDVSNALTGLDNTFQRAVEALSTKQTDAQSKITFGSVVPPKGGWLGGMQDAIAGLRSGTSTTTFRPSSEKLDEPTLAEELPKVIGSLNTIAMDLIKGLYAVLKDPLKGGELALGVSVGLFAELFEPLEILLFLWEVMKTPLEVISELAGERTRELVPIRKLDPATLTEAWKRAFIDAKQMDEEMLVQGYNADRSKLLRDLTRYVEDAQTLAEYRFRGIIADSDYTSGLRILGYTDSQIEAFRSGNYRLTDPAAAQTAFQRGLIDETGYKEILAVQRFNDAQQTLYVDLALRPSATGESLPARLRRDFVGAIAVDPSALDTVPDWFVAAGKAEGLNQDAITDRWWLSWNSLDVAAWVNLYFRGIRTYNELQAKLDEARIPRALHKDLIDSLRPIIPFRTIPSMVKAGILNQAEGLAALEAHGYSQFDATRLLLYATKTVSKSAANAAQNVHAVSLSTARTLYEDGSITEAQYRELLKEHGLSPAQIDATVQVEQVAAAARHRKETAQAVVYEFQAGLIDAPTAQQQIAALGYTQAEQAKYLRAIHAARVIKAKIPGEGDLNHMMQKSVISPDEYKAALVAQGYSQEWADAFEQWRNAATPASAGQTPAPTGP